MPHPIEAQDARKRRFLGAGERRQLESRLGEHMFRLWETAVATFDPAVESELVVE